MALKKTIPSRILPVLVALFILLNCVPVTSAAAASVVPAISIEGSVLHSHSFSWTCSMTVSSTGASFVCGSCDTSFNYTYSGDEVFAGLKYGTFTYGIATHTLTVSQTMILTVVTTAPVYTTIRLSGILKVGMGWERDVAEGEFSEFTLSDLVDCYVLDNGVFVRVDTISVQDDEIVCITADGSYVSYFKYNGEHRSDDGCLYFLGQMECQNANAIYFYENYVTQLTDIPCALVVDDALLHAHAEDWSFQTPVVSSSVAFSCSLCDWTYSYTYLGPGTFTGFENGETTDVYWGQCSFDISAPLYLRATSSSTPSSTKTATFVYDGNSYVFLGTADALPDVSMTVNNGILILASDSQSYNIEFSPDEIYGFKLSSAATSYVGIGETVLFPTDISTDSYTQILYPCYVSNATCVTGVRVYTHEGLFLCEFQFTGTGASPSLTLVVTESGFSLSDGSEVKRMDISDLYDSVAGYSDAPGKDLAKYLVDGSYVLQGATGASSYYDLYVVPGDPSDHQGVRFILAAFFSTFIEPIMVFYNAEFIPGFSFGRLALVGFLFGLLFWFLKVTK